MSSDLGNKKVMGRNIETLLRQNNVTRSELAKAIGVPYTTVSAWINGQTYPRIDRIEMMANFFGVQKKDLVEDEYRNIYESIQKHLAEARKNPSTSSMEEDVDFLRELHTRSEMKMLFSSVRGMTKDQIVALANLAQTFKGDD